MPPAALPSLPSGASPSSAEAAARCLAGTVRYGLGEAPTHVLAAVWHLVNRPVNSSRAFSWLGTYGIPVPRAIAPGYGKR